MHNLKLSSGGFRERSWYDFISSLKKHSDRIIYVSLIMTQLLWVARHYKTFLPSSRNVCPCVLLMAPLAATQYSDYSLKELLIFESHESTPDI